MASLRQLGEWLGVRIHGLPDGNDVEILRVDSIARATTGSLVFAEDNAALGEAQASEASAVVSFAGEAAATKPLLRVKHPRLAFARIAQRLKDFEAAEAQKKLPAEIHPSAMISASAQIGRDVAIGAYAVIGEGVHLGDEVNIGSGCSIGDGVVIGRRSRLYPRVVVYPGTALGERVVVHAGAILGADGFGYVRDSETGEYLQFPQQGRLVIEDNVEIGANATIDRGALDETRIGRGTKLDNLVHIGHNVEIGSNVVIAAQTGLSGSSKIAHGAVLAGQVGIGDHAEVGEGVILGGQAGILPGKKLVGKGQLFWGTPARPISAYLKQLATLARMANQGTGAKLRPPANSRADADQNAAPEKADAVPEKES